MTLERRSNFSHVELSALRDLMNAELRGVRELMDDRRRSDKEAVSAALAAAEKAVNAALASAEKAAEKFDQSLKEYKIGSNEWRGTVQGLVEQLREVTQLRQQVANLTERVNELRESRSQLSGARTQDLMHKVDIAKWIGWLFAVFGVGWAIFGRT